MSEMTTSEACAATAQFGRFIKGLARLQEVAAALEGADQLIRERQARADQVLASITEAEAKLASINSNGAAAVEAAAGIKAAAEASAAQIIASAREESDKTLAAARATEDEARNAATGVIARANAAERRLKVAQDELVGVEARIEQAKAEGRKIFGG